MYLFGARLLGVQVLIFLNILGMIGWLDVCSINTDLE